MSSSSSCSLRRRRRVVVILPRLLPPLLSLLLLANDRGRRYPHALADRDVADQQGKYIFQRLRGSRGKGGGNGRMRWGIRRNRKSKGYDGDTATADSVVVEDGSPQSSSSSPFVVLANLFITYVAISWIARCLLPRAKGWTGKFCRLVSYHLGRSRMESRTAKDEDGGTRRIGGMSGGGSGRGRGRNESKTRTKLTRRGDIDDAMSMSPSIMEIIDMGENASDDDTYDARMRRRTGKYPSSAYTAQATNERTTPSSNPRTAHRPDDAPGGRSRTRHGSGGIHDRKEQTYRDDDDYRASRIESLHNPSKVGSRVISEDEDDRHTRRRRHRHGAYATVDDDDGRVRGTGRMMRDAMAGGESSASDEAHASSGHSSCEGVVGARTRSCRGVT